MHYYSFNIGDYVSSTQHLEPMEDLAYRRMLDLYYSNEGPLPNDIDKIARLTRMRSHKDCIAIVLEDFFTLEKDGYHNNGADKALELVYKKSEAARKSAEARWNKNKDLAKKEDDANALNPHCEKDANGMLPNTHNTIPNTQYPVKQKASKDAIDFSILQMTSDELSELKRIRRKNKGGAITQRVANALAKEFNLAFDIGYSADEVLTEWETRGWKSFKSEWLKPKGGQSGFSQVTQKSLQNLEGSW